MTANNFIYALGKDIEGYIQDCVAIVVGAQSALKLGFDIDYNEMLKKLYKNLIRIQDKLNKIFETLDIEIENENRLLKDFMRLAEELELINGGDSNGTKNVS